VLTKAKSIQEEKKKMEKEMLSFQGRRLHSGPAAITVKAMRLPLRPAKRQRRIA
jgi:hypothetical protein